MKYRLSKRQVSDLTSGKRLRIALPHPAHEIDDPREWAMAHLDLPTSLIESQRLFTRAEAITVAVNPLVRKTGLATILGTIEHDPSPDTWTIEVECVVIEIATTKVPHGNYPTQWPGSLTLDDGRTLPEKSRPERSR